MYGLVKIIDECTDGGFQLGNHRIFTDVTVEERATERGVGDDAHAFTLDERREREALRCCIARRESADVPPDADAAAPAAAAAAAARRVPALVLNLEPAQVRMFHPSCSDIHPFKIVFKAADAFPIKRCDLTKL